MTVVTVPRRRNRRRPPADRFREKVDVRGPDDCWPWTGGTSNGYGCFRLDDVRRVSAHGYAKFLDTGEQCPAGKQPQHTCKTPASRLCCNPRHVVYDLPAATTVPLRGQASPSCILTDHDVRVIRLRASRGTRNVDLAAEYGVSPHYISQVKRGHRRTDVT